MAIAFDATSGAARGWVTSDSFSHTCTGSDRLLLVWVFFDRGNGTYNVSSLTYAGTALTQIGTFGDGYKHIELWGLLSPSTGANTLAASYNNSGPTAKIIIRALSYTGVSQDSAYGTLVSANGATNTATVNATSATGEVVVDFVSVQSYSQDLTAGTGQTARHEGDATSNTITAFGVSDEAGAATVTMSWTFSNDTWVIGAIPIKPTGTAAGGVPKTTKQTLLGVG